ncbi:hypothetical protein FWH09_02010 [Candidatus Saccharibacteria bacterium]|nr:hypothetical protein [Candidatus Saccharibacteria bacterium]
MKRKGYYVVPEGANPWPHEINVAKILKDAGHIVEFIPESNWKRPDIKLDGKEYEIKSPRSNRIAAVEQNLKRATGKCSNVIMDSSRMKDITDRSIQSYLVKKIKSQRSIKKLLFVNRERKIIDINDLALKS